MAYVINFVPFITSRSHLISDLFHFDAFLLNFFTFVCFEDLREWIFLRPLFIFMTDSQFGSVTLFDFRGDLLQCAFDESSANKLDLISLVERAHFSKSFLMLPLLFRRILSLKLFFMILLVLISPSSSASSDKSHSLSSNWIKSFCCIYIIKSNLNPHDM